MRFGSILVTLVILIAAGAPLAASPSPPPNRVTIVYDAFGNRPGLTRDWGFSALVEYGGKRILFDTGDDAGIFERNVRSLHIDLRRLDFVVISHRHGDHVAGMSYLLHVNPHVKIYAPREGFGIFGASLPGTFYRRDQSLPDSMRYFAGEPPEKLSFGAVWPGANLELVDSVVQVVPGVSLIATVSKTPGTLELRELSLAVTTPEGLMLMVGCSHPGIETILEASRAVGSHVHVIFGGMHLVTTADTAIARIAGALHDQWQVDIIAPGHCTGEPAFAALRRIYGDHYVYAGLGTVIGLP
jgi:7,8-dihydropterin-6-yl-methyl-4-(beta-D-ribofuranosyl)aminobenzene 5'-phosphate synthase